MKRLGIILMVVAGIGWAQEFRFVHRAGEKLRFLGLVEQRIWEYPQPFQGRSILEAARNPRFPWRLVGNAQMLNRIQQETLQVDENGRGLLRGVFQITETKTVHGRMETFKLSQEHETQFWRDTLGRYEIPSTAVMPVVRNVPTFDPSGAASWTAYGEEVHDLRAQFNIPDLIRVRFPVRYRRGGPAEFEGKTYETILTEYSFEQPIQPTFRPSSQPVPIAFAGMARQRIFWDSNEGRQVYYEEDYLLVLQFSNLWLIRFEGSSSSRVIEAAPLDREAETRRIRESLSDFPEVHVFPTERGITLQMGENVIRFPPDSAQLLSSEEEKLRRIAEVLRQYPDRDLLIEGHTALAGTEEGRQRLSEERARAVGDFLLRLGVRRPEQLLYRGWGATRPIAPNTTEEGRAMNRRVEITILEN